MTKSTEDLIERLANALDKEGIQEPHIFNDKEVEDLQYLLIVLQRLRVLGWFSKYALGALVVIGVIIVNIERIIQVFK